ncbi:MAG: polymorphic toxin type 23 domain-containing protein [Crocinitomicaceae bacterium]
MKKLLFIFMMLFSFQTAKAVDSFFGFSAGLSFSFGTHINRLGFQAAAYYNYGFAQANASINGYYNFQSLALKKKGLELQLGSGLELGFGRKDSARNPFVGLTESNLLQDYSVGYSYLIYLDQQKTSQSGGILSFNIKEFKFATENDLFGFGQGWRDRYRTGGFLIEYRYQQFKFGINSTLWTDDYSLCKKVLDTDYPARFGYKEDSKTKFGGISAGLISAQVKYLMPTNIYPYGQNLQANIGLNSEKARNLIQNRFIHDHFFIPKNWISRNPCHIPMEAEGGGQYLFKEDQTIKKTQFYFNLGTNQGVFY